MALPFQRFLLQEQVDHARVEPVGSGIVESAGDHSEDREIFRVRVKQTVAAAVLLADRVESIFGSRFIELVDDNDIREVEHVNLLKLRRRAELRGHYIDAEVHEVSDLGIALADPGGFDKHEVVAGRTEQADGVLEGFGGGEVRASRRQ